jgi:signal recognition particle subunit SRP54
MFDSLSDSLSKIFNKLTRSGRLSESDIDDAMREIRVALLGADVALSVVKEFTTKVKESIVGQEMVKSISPGQMVIKLVNDHLCEMLGTDRSDLNFNTTPPAVIMMVGLQGSGKTTTSAKLALRLRQKHNKKVLLASLDTARPAAQEQLETLAKQIAVSSLPIIAGEDPVTISKRAIKSGELGGYDVVILDTAGRLHIDEALMQELEQIKALTKPIEILLVADAMTGQDAVKIAKHFHDTLQITGSILTRIDGDSRGGAALSIKAVTGCPIKFMGVGEKMSDLEEFHPERIASRILDMGDIVSLVERAASMQDMQEAEKMAKKLQKGHFDLNDLAAQIKNIKKIGGVGNIISMLPGAGKLKGQLGDMEANEKKFLRQEAIISSMTKQERRNPDIINASRRKRIAAGSGTQVQDVNALLKQHQMMSKMIKKIGKMDKKTLMRSGFGGMFG